MATEAEVPESVSATTEGEGGYLTAGKFDITVNQFSPVQLKKSEGEEDQHPEPVKCFVEGEIASVESKNGISECGNPLEPLSDSKVDKHEEDTLRKGEALDVGEASVAKEEDSEGFSAVEHSKTSSTDHEGENETDLFEQIQPVTHELARPKLNSEEDEAATSRESSKTTTAGDERQVVKQSCEEEGKVEEANTSYDTIEDETPGEQNLPVASILMRIVTESEIAEVGESTISEPNEIVERSEGGLNVSTVKGDEGDQGDGTNATKDGKDVDTFTAKAAEDDEYTSAVTIKETSAKVTPNDDESSPQTVQICDSGEDLQHSRDVLPEETKTETSRENAEEITCTKEETTIQHAQESLDEEKKEATENTRNLEDDNAREEVLETSSTKQETGEHVVGEIHTESPQDFVDKETNEETPTEYQACVEAADLSTYTEEKNLEEQAIPELSSLLVVEETAKEIPKEEETAVLILKEEKKEEDTECNEPAEVASMTHETQSETTEDTTEPNKDLSAPISEESNKTFVENISTLAEVSKTETEKNIQEKNGLAVSNSDSASGEVSHVTGLKEAETEKEQQKENIDTAPEEKGQATILKDETVSEVEEIGAQAEENCESIEKLEEHIPTAADKVETFSKEAEAENEELINNNDVAAEEKVSETILTNERTFDVEDTNVQAEKNVKSNENLEENIPTAADEGETSLQEAEAESKDEIKSTDIAHAGTDGRGDEIDNSEESLDKQIPAGECETSLKAAEAEYKEQVKHADIVPEEKGLATVLTDETPLNVEDIEVKTEDCVESKENVEEQILTAADESEKSTYISPEDIEVQEDENFITLENLENPILSTSGERESGLGEAEEEIKEQVKSIDIVPEEIATISTAETPLDVEDIGVQAEESLKSKENVEEQIPTAADDGEKFLKEAEAESKEQIGEEIWNSQESSDKGKQKVTEITNTQEDDTAREKVLETTSREQKTGEHVAHEIHTVVEPPRDSIDKETNEENSTGYQACTEGADLSTAAEEKNLEEQPILELSSPLVVEETAKEIAKEEETDVLILKEEEKEEDAKCNKPSEVTSITHETQSETTEDITEPNKDLNAPISEESNKTFVENISILAEVSETETEKNIEEKDGLAVSNSDSVTGEVSHVTGLKEAETENEEQKESIDTAPEEKGQATILKDETASEIEDIGAQAEENCESKEKLEEHIPTAADEGETFSKEAEAENEEQKNNSDVAAEEKVLETILTNEKSFEVEDTNVQAEKNAKSNENLEENIPTADEGETSLQEAEEESKDEIRSTDIAHADTDGHGDEIDNSEESLDKQIPAGQRETSLEAVEAEYKEQVKHADIVPEEKSLTTILTDETPLNVEDIEVKTEDRVESKENVEEQIPTTADEGEKSTYISPEDIEVQEDENFITQENLENPILTTSDEGEKGSGEAEAEIKEQVKSFDIVPEEIATISTAETPLDVEDIGVQAEESLKSKEKVEEQIPTAADGGEKFLKEAEAENKEQIDKENLNSQESSDKGKQEVTEITNTLEDDTAREEVLETTSTEQESGEHVAHEIRTVVEPPRGSIDKETNEENSAGYQACTEAADLSTTAEEKNLEEQPILELSSPLVEEETAKEITKEYKTDVLILKEEEKEEDEKCNKPSEVTSITHETQSETTEDITEPNKDLTAPISEESNKTFVENISTLAEESETETEKNIEEKDGLAVSNSDSVTGEVSHVTGLKEAETENEEQKESIDTAPEENGQATILKDETASSKEKLEEHIPTAANEGETFSKEAEAENEEQIHNSDVAAEEKVSETILTNEKSFDAEDTNLQAEKNAESNENLEENIPTAVDEGETSLQEGEAESKDEIKSTDIAHADTDGQGDEIDNSEENLDKQIPAGERVTSLKAAEAEYKKQGKHADIVPEEKGLATILTDETPLDVEDIEVKTEDCVESKENVEEQIPTTADEGEKSTYISPEDIEVQADENFITPENLENPILTTSGEQETGLGEAEAETKEQVKSIDIVPEEMATISTAETPSDVEVISIQAEESLKSKEIGIDIVPEEISTISTAETPLDVEDIGVQAEESLKSKENVEEQIPTAADEGEKFLKEAEAENKEQIDEENLNSQESSDKGKQEVTETTNTLEDDTAREEVLETTSTEQETGDHVVHEIHTVVEPPRDSIDKETNEENSAGYQASTDAADLSTTAEEKNLEEHDIQELSSPLVVEEETNEIPKEEETYATLLEEEKKEGHATCNEPTEKYEAEIEKNIQEKDGNTVSNSESLSGELSHVTALHECETEIERQDKNIDTTAEENIDTAPEEKGQATIWKGETASEVEDIGVQAEEKCESKENLEEHIPTAADKVETFPKEAKAENEEQINNSDVAAEEKVLQTILTNEKSFDVEDTNVQAEKNVESNENLEENVPTAADEGETFPKEAEVESKDEIKNADIPHADIDGHGDEIDSSEQNLDKQIPAGECETSFKAAEAEYKEQVIHADIVPEEKGLVTILKDETPLDVEDIEVKTEDCVESKENVEERIPTTADEGEKSTYISQEDIEVQADENITTLDNLENLIPTTSGERETGLREAEAEIKEQVKSIDIVPEEIATISTAETLLDVEDIGVQAEESLKSKENVEEQIPTAANEGENFLKETEAENKEQIDEETLNSQESSDIEKEEVTETTNTKDDTEREEVIETTSTEQEIGEHVVHEIHTVPEPPRDSIDKETNEDNSVEYQACTEAADLSTSAEEKNLEEHAIRELSSLLVVEEATNEISKEEKTYTTLLEEEEKEGHATCNEPNEEYEAEIEKNIQEKDDYTVSNSESLSGELSHVTALKESETVIERQDKNIDTAPEEKGQATISADETASEVEDIDVQLKENLESEENLEEQIPIAADEGEIISKEAEAEKQEQIKNVDIAHEDVDAQAEKTVNLEENIDTQIPPIAHEGETSLKETTVLILKEEKKEEETECNEPAEVASMTHETQSETTEAITEPNKSLNAPISGESNKTFVENISTLAEVSETETEKNVQEKNGLAVSNSDSASGEVSNVRGLKEAETEKEEQKENIDTAPEDKGQAPILKGETASEVEDIGVQEEENCESKENLEERIPTAADKVETFSKEAEAENEEQINNSDVAAEEKVLQTISTNEKSFDMEDTSVQAEKNVESNENLEENFPTTADEGETSLQEAEAESKDEIKSTDIAHADTDGQGDEIDNSEENLDKHIPAGERETSLKAAEAEYKEQGKHADIVPEEKGLATILTDETPLDVEDIEVKTEEYVESKENMGEQIPTTADEGEKSTYISPEDIEVQADENFITQENLENPIPTTSGERETGLGEAEAGIKEQVKSIDIVPEEIVTISTAETPSDVEDIGVQAEESLKSKENVEEQIPTAADEGENFLKEAEAENTEQIDEETLNSQESSDKEKEEVTEITNTKDDTEREEVLETTSTEQETGEHVLHEIHTVPEPPRDSIDKETNEDNSAEYQACTEAADLSTSAEEKNLKEHAIQELSSPLVVEEATNEISKEEETYTTFLEEEEKEGHATCNEPNEEYEAEIEKNIQEKDGNTVSNSESLSGELSHVTALKESETEVERQDKNIDTAPEEKGQATIPADETASEVEDIDVQLKENLELEENLEEQFPIAADEGEIILKEAEAENQEQIKNVDIAHEDVDAQAEKTVDSEENIDKQIPPIAHEGETSLKEAEAEDKEQVTYADIAPEEKGLATILIDETPLEAEDIGVEVEESFETKEKFEEQNPIAAGEDETLLKEAEAENKEQIKYSDIASEEKGLATILTDEKASNIEDIGLQAEETFNSSGNLESKIPSTADEHETSLKEAEAVSTEQVTYVDIVPEEKGLATILTDETPLEAEDVGVQAEESFEPKEKFEEKNPITADEDETFLKEAEAENKEQIKSSGISPQEKGLATISTDEATLEVEDIGVQAEKSFESKEDFEEKIPTAADEDETCLKEAEAETKEHIKCSDIAPEEKGLANILTDETSLDVKDIEVKADDSFESNENLEEQIPTAEGEGETRLREAEAESDEQVKNYIAPEEKVLETISKDEMALDIDDACVQPQAEENSDTKEFSDEQNPTVADEGEEKVAHGNVVLNDTPGVQILEEAEPEVGVEEERCKSDQPEKTNTIVEEVFDESKITGRDFNKEEIAEGNVACFTQESIEEDTVNKSQEIEIENTNLKEEGSCMESSKEGNGDDLSPDYIREDESETLKDDQKDTVKSGGQILKESQADGVDESITCETTMIAERSEQIVTSPVKYEEGEQGESSSPVSKEEGSNEDTFSTKVAEEGNGDNGAVTVIETSADVNGEEGLPQAVQKYEPFEGHEKLLDLMPEESKTESSSKNAEVVTCTKEEIKIQNIQESLDEEKKEEETTPANDTKENETEVEEVLEIASTEQETGEHATREIHTVEDNTQEFNDKETTEENLNEYQVSSEAADSSTDIVGKNSDEQASRELSSLLVGEDTSIESSKQEENYVSSLKEEENEANVECKEPVEVANTAHETKFETLEDSIEPKEDLYAPTSEEETHTDLKGAEAETKEQVKDIEIDHEEKGLATILTDGAAMENVDSEEFSEDHIPTVADEGEYNTELVGDKAVEESFQVQSLEEAEPKLTVEDESHESKDYPENNNMIVEEPQLLEQVLDEPKSTDGDFGEAQTTEGNAAICTPDTIQEETAKNSQDTDKEGENLQEEILKEPEIAGVGESTTCETNQIAETSEEIFDASPLKCEEGQLGEGSSEDTFSIKVAEDGDGDNGAVTVIETSADVNGEEGLPQAVQKYEPVEGHEKLLDLMPEESKTESSSKNAEVVTCTKEEIKIQNIQESLDEEEKEEETTPANDTKENETEVEEAFGIASTEQETGEHATREIHTVEDNTQEFNDKETTKENLNEYQVSSEAADSSTDIVGKNSDEQASRELTSSLVGEDTSIKSSKQEENYVLSLVEEENEATVECKEPVKVAITAHETQFETLDNSIEPREDLYAPTSEEETHTDLKGAEAETKEQVKDIEIDREEKGLATILTDGAALENVDSEEFSEDQIPTVADEGEYNTALAGDKAAQESFQVQSLEEAEPKLTVEDESRESRDYPENNNMILEEPQQPEQVLDEPKSTGRDFSEGQTTEGNAAICTPERIQEETAKNSQDGDKETENLMEEGSSIESVKACNTDDPSQEFILEDGSKKFDDNKQDTVKFEGEILKETEIAGVGESTTYEMKQMAESSEEISGASPVKYEEGQPGEGSSQDSAKASRDEDVTEEDDNNGAVTVTESSAEVASKGEEESAQALEKSEPEEEKVPVKFSDVADAKEVCDLEDKAPFAEKTTEETSLQTEGHAEVSELAPEKLDVEATEEEFKESSEIVPESDSRSIDVVSKDEIVTSQTLDEGISQEQVEIPSSTLLTEAKEIEASQHEHETPAKDKNIEEEHEKEMPADENTRDLSAERSEDETPLQKEESKELKASELALEKLDAGDTEEGIKETLKTISKSDSQSTDAVLKDEIVADQTHLEASYALLPMEEKLKTYQDDRETTTQEKIVEEEYAKKTEVPADENGRDLVATTLAEETLLKEEPGELKVSELAPENLDAGETKEEIKKSFEKVSKSDSQSAEVVSGDETTAYQTELAGDKAVEESFQVQGLEEAEPILRVEDESSKSEDHPENNNMIVEEPQLLERVLDEPKSTDGDSSEGQTTKCNAAICTPEIIEEGTAKNSQDSDKETENSQEEILKEPEVAGVGESTTYETNQIAETSEEIFDASPVKYEEGRPGEGSSQDSAKASKEEDVTEDDNSNGAVTVTESNADVTSKGEEDSAQPLEKYEPEEEKVPVKISDVADAKEVCNVEDKASFAEKTTEETSLQTEGHAEVSELAPEKLDVEATEEEFKEGSEIVCESDYRSIDVVLKDEIATSQTLEQGISQEQVEIPSSTLLTEAKEIEASQHEHETPAKDKNIEEEHEKEIPADEIAGDLSAVKSEDETPLPKEESEELKPSELALEKLDAGDTEEIKETLKTISESDSQSTDAVLKDEIVADQIHLEASSASLPKEEELKTYQDDLETTTQDKSVEEEYAKETEVPADENGRDLVAPTLAEETLLQKEEPEELKVSELAPENLDAGETEEEIKESFEKVSKSDSQSSEVVSGDETTAYQTLHEGISSEQLQLPSSTLVPEEKEIKISQREHETTTQDKNKEGGSTEKNEVPDDENTRDLFVAAISEEEICLQKEEPREFKACELAPEKVDAGETEDIKETLETISTSDSQSIDTVSKDDIVAEQTLVGESYTSLPKEKEHEAGENEVPADENGGDLISARSIEETILQREDARELKVSEVAPEELNAGDYEEEIKKTPERVSKPESPSTDVVSRDEAISDQILYEGISTEKLQIPSSVLLPEEKEIKALEEAKETSLIKEEPRELKASDFEPHLTPEVPTESSNEEITEDEKLPEELEPASVREESHHENKAKAEKQEELTEETSTIRTNEHQNELSEVDEKGIPSEKYERQLTFEDLSIKEHDPRFIEDKTIQDSFPEEEKRVEEAAFEFGIKNQEEEINSKSSMTQETQIQKDSKNSPIVETSQEVEAKDTKSSNDTCIAPEIKERIQVGTHLPEEKEATTTSKEQQIEEDEEDEHEHSEEVKTDEEKGENEHKNGEPGYDSPIMVEASRDADVKVVSHKKSNNIFSGIKHSISKVKKAITCTSSHSKTRSEK